LRDLTSRNGALLIFDEVMTGFRVALGGAQAAYNINPDLTTLGKVIGGGLPVGAYGGRRDIMTHVAPAGSMYQAGTLSGNPLAMAAGLATLRAWSAPGVFEKTAGATRSLVEGLRMIAGERGIPLQAGYAGTMFGFFFTAETVTDYTSAKTSDTALYAKVFHAMLERGVYLAPSQFEAGFMSATHDESVIAATLEAFRGALAR
jgi:glutamate-1-semialdehyde 2,1-aminomutase